MTAGLTGNQRPSQIDEVRQLTNTVKQVAVGMAVALVYRQALGSVWLDAARGLRQRPSFRGATPNDTLCVTNRDHSISCRRPDGQRGMRHQEQCARATHAGSQQGE